MTAVEWLIKKITNSQNGIFDGFPHLSLDEIYDKAKEMEKQQHGKTWDAALDAGQSRAWNVMRAYSDFDDYYDETYGSKGSGMSGKPNDHIVDTNIIVSSQTKISDEEIFNAAKIQHSEELISHILSFVCGAKWYREQLKQK